MPSSNHLPHTRPERQPRVPNFKRFLITGAVLGFVVGAVVSLLGDDVQGYSATSGVLYIGAFGAFIGTGLAGIVAVLLDRSGRDSS
ncbi:hypothetical protein LQK93_01271 [Terrabacter sp. BE26]